MEFLLDYGEEEEIWRPFHDTGYEVSSRGRVKCKNGTLKSLQTTSHGYKKVDIFVKHRKSLYVHRMVAQTFLTGPRAEDQKVVDHINRNKGDNVVGNLRWATYSENSKNSDYCIGLKTQNGTRQ